MLSGTMACPSPAEPSGLGLRILVVDDHALLREGLRQMLERAGSGWHVDEAANGHEALERLRSAHYDVALFDISMPGMSGLDLLRRSRTEYPGLRVLMLSMYAEEHYAMRAFRAGANGYLTKDSAARELIAAVAKLLSGGTYVTPGLAERLALSLSERHADPLHHHLTDREFDVLRRLAAGSRPIEIAEALHISTKTVSTHKTRILERLKLPNTAALIRYALEHDLISDTLEPDAGH